MKMVSSAVWVVGWLNTARKKNDGFHKVKCSGKIKKKVRITCMKESVDYY